MLNVSAVNTSLLMGDRQPNARSQPARHSDYAILLGCAACVRESAASSAGSRRW